ncbi:mitogen-activated protein kinase kinase kinase 7, putative [Bodo saltans]|uniref:Mitogen-activated protein kinase kinase kinase 7, putative n=1 Tax=Bodo saltans TaxID=75058 RepID=A0A0S4IWK8_BODSA|nr:mitogen-activated protein kinase kinase kinase 7, putative [Bodo saltans]|eukprot:CUG06338.1 mitogen-activated protein kinase kinase kinase 7, putative [Bodo saltans]
MSLLFTAGHLMTTIRMFIAPESVGGTSPTKASDVFSFGMTMWCALSPLGTDHGLGKADFEVSLALIQGRRPPVAALDPSYASLIQRCWAAEPSERPSMVEVEEALRNLVACACLSQPQPTPSTRLWTTLLQSYHMEAAVAALKYRSEEGMFFSDSMVDVTNPTCFRFVAGIAGAPFQTPCEWSSRSPMPQPLTASSRSTNRKGVVSLSTLPSA